MDFKIRLQQNQAGNSKAVSQQFFKQNKPQKVNPSGWDKYARQTIPNQARQTSNQPTTANKPQNIQTNVSQKLKVNISRYYRPDAAPKNQFKHYLSDINNVFYEQRQDLIKINLYDNIRWYTGIFWVILLVIFIIVSFIHPYEGVCPHNADCGVFVHCFNGFGYDSQSNQCVLSQDLYDQIESVCLNRIFKARQDWANQQCNQQEQSSHRVQLQQLLSGITNNQLIRQLTTKLQQFLLNPQNQQNYHFNYYSIAKQIVPTQKKYTILCYLKLFINKINFKLTIPIFIIICGLVGYAINQIRKRMIARKIYQQLRKRTLAEKLLNISFAKPDMEKQYGVIDQKLWELIDSHRSKDRDIGFLQDDFLYWKLL